MQIPRRGAARRARRRRTPRAAQRRSTGRCALRRPIPSVFAGRTSQPNPPIGAHTPLEIEEACLDRKDRIVESISPAFLAQRRMFAHERGRRALFTYLKFWTVCRNRRCRRKRRCIGDVAMCENFCGVLRDRSRPQRRSAECGRGEPHHAGGRQQGRHRRSELAQRGDAAGTHAGLNSAFREKCRNRPGIGIGEVPKSHSPRAFSPRNGFSPLATHCRHIQVA